jgi:DNA-binding response OmpR family regulator
MSSSPSARLLVAHADPEARTDLLARLRAAGYGVTTASDAASVVGMLHHPPHFDLAVLDFDLPEGGALGVLRHAADIEPVPAFFVLAASAATQDCLRCFRFGADDYVESQAATEEVVARVEAILARRAHAPDADGANGAARLGDLRVDLDARTCHHDDQLVRLTTLEFDLLSYLLRHQPRTIPRDELATHLWSERAVRPASLRAVDQCVAALRQKIEPTPSRPQYVHTICRKGYRLSAEV